MLLLTASLTRHIEVRQKVVQWLKENENFLVDDQGTLLCDFLVLDDYSSWKEFLTIMSKETTWGDHLTLVAASEAFQVRIWILSSLSGKSKH